MHMTSLIFFNLLCSAGTCPAFIFCSGKNGNEKIKTFHFLKKALTILKKNKKKLKKIVFCLQALFYILLSDQPLTLFKNIGPKRWGLK